MFELLRKSKVKKKEMDLSCEMCGRAVKKKDSFSITLFGFHNEDGQYTEEKKKYYCSVECSPSCLFCHKKGLLYFHCWNTAQCNNFMCLGCMNLARQQNLLYEVQPYPNLSYQQVEHVLCSFCQKQCLDARDDMVHLILEKILVSDLVDIILSNFYVDTDPRK